MSTVQKTREPSAQELRGLPPKPVLRGWIHTVVTPLALAAGIVFIALAPTALGKVTMAIFSLSAVQLFACSAVYHLGNWSVRVDGVLRRLDHSNIFFLIAGTYTPLSVLLLTPGEATILLSAVWGGALIGTLMRIFWLGAPRWVYTPLYVLLGWAAVFYLPSFARAGGTAVLWLVIAGGLSYTMGALVYGTKWPNPLPRWFGFHEIFHIFTVGGYVCHLVATAIVVLTI